MKRKTTKALRDAITARYIGGESARELAQEFKISTNYIYQFVGRRAARIGTARIYIDPRRRRPKDELPMQARQFAEERRNTERILREVPKTVNLNQQAIVNANPDGSVCSVKACPFPAMIDGICRQHFIDSRSGYSLNPSSHSQLFTHSLY